MMEPSLEDVQGLRVAVEGCGHGTLNAIYASIEKACERRRWDGVDLLIIGGDFQAVRNAFDLTVMSCPPKYREVGDFYEYYSGVRKAPYLTIFVGGNHEASSHLWELYYGGWVAPNIFYMGAANVVRLGPVRIAGMSGIWKGYNYNKPHYERLPYNEDDIKSIYHVRELDVRKLLQIRSQVDIAISHDWPRAIEKHGDEKHLFKLKPDFEQESKNGTLGSHAATYVMDRLRPPYWFAAHMHCKFAATRTYNEDLKSVTGAENTPSSRSLVGVKAEGLLAGESSRAPAHNADEIDLDMDEDDSPTAGADGKADTSVPSTRLSTTSAVPEDLRAQLPAAFARPAVHTKQLQPGQPCPLTITNKAVRFLALDKCLPGRKFLQLLDIEPSSKSTLSLPSPSRPRFYLQYDPEWLAITRVFASALILGDRTAQTPIDLGEEHYRPLIEAEEAWVGEYIAKAGKLTIPGNFTITAPVHSPGMPETVQEGPQEYNNPQTVAFCDLVGIGNAFFATEEERAKRMSQGPALVVPRRDGRFSGGRGKSRDSGHGQGGWRNRESGRGSGRGRFRGRG